MANTEHHGSPQRQRNIPSTQESDSKPGGKTGRRFAITTSIGAAGAAIATTAALLLSRGDRGSQTPKDPETGGNAITPTLVAPTAEALTPTPTVEKERLPYELGWESPMYGNVSFGIQKEAMEERDVPNPNVGMKGSTVKAPGIHSITLNKEGSEGFPDAEQRLNDAVLFGQYKGLQTANPETKNMTFEEYKTKVANGEDLSFTIKGFAGKSFLLSDITIDPRESVQFVYVAEPIAQLHPFDGYSFGYRKVGKTLHIEIYDWQDTNYSNNDPAKGIPSKYSATSGMSWALGILSEESVQKTGTFSFSQVSGAMPKRYKMDEFLIPYKGIDFWNSIIRAH